MSDVNFEGMSSDDIRDEYVRRFGPIPFSVVNLSDLIAVLKGERAPLKRCDVLASGDMSEGSVAGFAVLALAAVGGLAWWLTRPTWKYTAYDYANGKLVSQHTIREGVADSDVVGEDAGFTMHFAGKPVFVERTRSDEPRVSTIVVNHDETGKPLPGFEAGVVGSKTAGGPSNLIIASMAKKPPVLWNYFKQYVSAVGSLDPASQSFVAAAVPESMTAKMDAAQVAMATAEDTQNVLYRWLADGTGGPVVLSNTAGWEVSQLQPLT